MIDTKELSRIGHDLKCRVYEVDCFMFGVSSSPPLAAMMKVGKALFSAQDGTMVTEAANRLQEAADELDAARARELAHEKELEASKEATRHEYERCKELESQLAEARERAERAEQLVFGEFVAWQSYSCNGNYEIEEDGEEPFLEHSITGKSAEECIKNFFDAVESEPPAIEAASKEEK